MADLGCSPNATVAYDFLISRGLSDVQAAAVVGNLQQESGLDPRSTNQSEGARGIAQWHAERWQNLLAFAATQGRSEWDLGLQLEFVWHELESNPSFGLDALRGSSTIEAATIAFQDRFERCGVCAQEKRIALAKAALFACPGLRPPTARPKKTSKLTAALGLIALASAAGYGAYEARMRWGRA